MEYVLIWLINYVLGWLNYYVKTLVGNKKLCDNKIWFKILQWISNKTVQSDAYIEKQKQSYIHIIMGFFTLSNRHIWTCKKILKMNITPSYRQIQKCKCL